MDGNSLGRRRPGQPKSWASWRAVGADYFNNDSDVDILFQNASGQASVWEMVGNHVIGGGPINANPGPSRHAIDVWGGTAEAGKTEEESVAQKERQTILWKNEPPR
jgi:hypothetical protein